MDDRQWIEEQMADWLGRFLPKFSAEKAKMLEDFRAGRRGLDSEVQELLSALKFLANRRPKISANGYPICPHCQLELDETLEELRSLFKNDPANSSLVFKLFKCPGCRQSIDVG
jgi:hypothetical protein